MTRQDLDRAEDWLVIADPAIDAEQARRVLEFLAEHNLLADRRIGLCAVCRMPFVRGPGTHLYCAPACKQQRYRQTRLPGQAERHRAANRRWYARRRVA